jgi:short-subunit dehydrogenase
MGFKEQYGPWAVVAGASTGLGAAFGEEAAKRGIDVVLVARRTALLETTAEAIRSRYGVKVRTLTADLAGSEELLRGIEGLDVVLFIYNAAAEPQGLFIDESLSGLRTNIDVNCTTPTVVSHAVANRMVARGSGGLVLVSSTGALQGIKVFAAYGAAKSYELILAEGLWDELREHGVDAFSFVVGATATPNFLENAAAMTPDADLLSELISQVGASALEPRSCEFVAAALFQVLDAGRAGIGPRHYSHPDDESAAVAAAGTSRAEVVSRMGKITSAFWQ